MLTKLHKFKESTKESIKLTKTKNTDMYDFSYKMKKDIVQWWKTNMDFEIDKEIANVFKKLVNHEFVHYKIVKNSAKDINLILELEKAEEGITGFYYNASCVYTFPHIFNLPKYYPKFILIEFKHFLFDVICDTFNFEIFAIFRYRLFKFLECLISFKVRS